MLVPGFKFIIFEFETERKGELDNNRTKCGLKAGLKRSIENNTPTGYYFRWIVELYSSKGQFLHCIAEGNYLELKMTPVSTKKIFGFMNDSHDQFMEAFSRKMEILDFKYSPVFNLKMEDAQSLYEEYVRG